MSFFKLIFQQEKGTHEYHVMHEDTYLRSTSNINPSFTILSVFWNSSILVVTHLNLLEVNMGSSLNHKGCFSSFFSNESIYM